MPECLAFVSGSTWMVSTRHCSNLPPASAAFDLVADFMGRPSRHLPRHDKVKIDESRLARMTHPEIVSLAAPRHSTKSAPGCARASFGHRFVHEAADQFAHQLPA